MGAIASTTTAAVLADAQELLGFDELRPGQAEATAAVLDGRDVLAVMPTGSGKSAIYQIAGARRPGPTLVVSPLIALQHDQAERIGDELGGAVLVNSTLSDAERRAILDDVAQGGVEMVFAAPEQLANDDVGDALRAAGVSLVVVDEAHCISTWGHDFRPDYRRLRGVIDELGRPPVLALTATAAPPVRADILEQLGLRDPAVVVAGFERPNIHCSVVLVDDDDAIGSGIVAEVRQRTGTGLVYVATRQETEALADELSTDERPALAYHGGLKRSEREAVHERFGADDPCVVVATTAFGMGIDVPHVRFVVHAGAPESLDSYLQELGRAGRDGEPADAVLVHPRRGGGGRQFFAGIGEIPAAEVEGVAEALAAVPEPLPVDVLAEVTDLTDTRLHQVLGLLQQADAIELDDGSARWRAARPVVDVAEEAAAIREAEREVERTRRDMVQRYIDDDGCRWRALLAYFGEPRTEPCGHCDRCDAGTSAPAPTDGPFAAGTAVTHAQFGSGQVVQVDERTVTVLFDEAGYRTLDLETIVANGLLEAASG